MNDLIATQGPTGARPKEGGGASLAKIEAAYIAPIGSVPGASVYKDLRRLLDDDGTARERWRALSRALEIAPSTGELETFIAAGGHALDAAPDSNKSRMMIGLLLAAYPNGRPSDFNTYADTLLHDVLSMGFSPHVIAHACQSIRREVKFLPSVAEVVAACTKARGEIASAHRLATILRERLIAAREAVALPEPEPVAWDRYRDREEAETRAKTETAPRSFSRLPSVASGAEPASASKPRPVGFV